MSLRRIRAWTTQGGRRELTLVMIAVTLTFAASVHFPFLAWDDLRYASANPLVLHPLSQGWRTLLMTRPLGYPQPLTVLSYALTASAFGVSAWSFHLVNLLLHLINVVLAWRVACSLTLSGRTAAFAAMIFGLHPLVVEPVCWVTGRKDLLAATFVLSALATVLRGPRDAPFPGLLRWAAVSALTILGIGAKPSVAIAPLLVWLVARVARPSWSARRLALALAPLAAIGLSLLVAEGSLVADVHRRTPTEAGLDALGAWTLQGGHVLWPVDLVTSYARMDGDPSVSAMILGAAALLALLVVASRLDRRSAAFTGLAFAAVAYAPVAGVLAVNRWTADSYMYLPLVGLAIGGAAFASDHLPARYARAAPFGAALLGLVWMTDSFAHASNWRAPEGPWLAAIERYPTNPVPYSEVASTLVWEGDRAGGLRAYLALDERFPDFESARAPRADALASTGRRDRARELLKLGVDASDRLCARAYWMMLVDGRLAVTREDGPLAARAFAMVFDEMRTDIHERDVWLRIASLLGEAGLEDDARKAAAVAAATPL